MKRLDLIRHLEQHGWEHHGCEFRREGGSHTIYVNRAKKMASSMTRRPNITEFTSRKI